MGNTLSTWEFTYESAVAGPNYNYNPEYNQTNLPSDYTQFYIGIGAVTLVCGLLIILNLLLSWKFKKYWNSRYTGNRYILPVFVLPPKDQTPLDI